MRNAQRLAVLALAMMVLFASPGLAQPDLRLVREVEANSLILVRPDWPVPTDPGQVFFVQRSMNPNTVVYAVRTTAQGALDRSDPMLVYWRRYNNDGAARALNYVENRFAYGVRVRPMSDGRFDVRLRALPDIALILEPIDQRPGARLVLERENRRLLLTYAYVHIDESSLLPAVTQMELVGRDMETGTYRRLTIAVDGGEIEETQ